MRVWTIAGLVLLVGAAGLGAQLQLDPITIERPLEITITNEGVTLQPVRPSISLFGPAVPVRVIDQTAGLQAVFLGEFRLVPVELSADWFSMVNVNAPLEVETKAPEGTFFGAVPGIKVDFDLEQHLSAQDLQKLTKLFSLDPDAVGIVKFSVTAFNGRTWIKVDPGFGVKR